MLKYHLLPINLHLHDANVQVTTNATAGTNDMSPEMKTFYNKTLLVNAKPKLVHNRFGQQKDIPAHGGKIIEFRRFSPLPKALTALTEGVTPNGLNLNVSSLTATVSQYGAYITTSDMLAMTTIDPVLVQASELLGDQAGETLDTITREVLNGGTTVQYGDGTVASRAALTGGDSTWANNDYFDCEVIRRAVLTLKNNKAKGLSELGGKFACIIHTESEYALKRAEEWLLANRPQNAQKIFDGSIGEFDGCVFFVSTESKIFSAAPLAAAGRTLTVASLNTKTFTVDEALTAADKASMEGRYIWIKGVQYSVKTVTAGAAGAATIEVNETVTGEPGDGEIVYPGDMLKDGVKMPNKDVDVGTALFIGENAYGTTKIEGMGLQTITKQLGSGGTEDPLNQRATHGWKATHVAERLSELFMVRAEVVHPHKLGSN